MRLRLVNFCFFHLQFNIKFYNCYLHALAFICSHIVNYENTFLALNCMANSVDQILDDNKKIYLMFQPLPQNIVDLLKTFIEQDQRPLGSLKIVHSQIPSVRNEQDDITRLKNNNIHIWVLIHNLGKDERDQRIKQTDDYKQFLKMYDKSKYLSQRFHTHINRIKETFNQFNNRLQLSIKCLIYAPVITDSELWKKVKPLLESDFVSQIVVKSTSQKPNVKEDQRLQCEQRFNYDFRNKERYSGFVQNFNDALELQKKILNLTMSKLKPNFFIINEYETLEASQNLNSFHDILVNTKAYLKQSFDIKSKQKVLESLESFSQYIWDQFRQYYQIYEKQKKPELQLKKQNQLKILEVFFKKAKSTIIDSYPFREKEIQSQFYDDVLRLYTEETVVYGSVNSLCKTITSKQIFMKIAFFCKFLNLAIKHKGREQVSSAQSVRLYRQRYYRGSMMSQIEWQSLTNAIQADNMRYVINLAFTSTSKSPQVAERFYKNNVKNNILIQITINKLFLKYYDTQPYSDYIQYYLSLLEVSEKNQQQVIFNCFNVFKVIGFKSDQKQRRVLLLQAFSHLQIIQKKQEGKKISPIQEKILDVIVRIQKSRDYAEQLKEQGKHQQMVIYLDKVVDSGVELNVAQAENYIQFMAQVGKNHAVQNFIRKLQEKAEKTAEESMKLAVYESIQQQFLQTQFYLLSAIKKKQEENLRKTKRPSQIGQKEDTYQIQSRIELIDKCNLNHAISINKQKIGSYEECFMSINQNLNKVYPQLQISQFLENIQIWYKFYPYIMQSSTKRAQSLKQNKSKFDQLYSEFFKGSLKKQDLHQLKSFLILQNEKNFFIEFFQQQRHEFINNNELRRDFESYKNQFYQRIKLKTKIVMFYYEILIKSERIEMFKSEQQRQQKGTSQVFKNLFQLYFQTNKPFFQNVQAIYSHQLNQKYNYEKALFLKQYGKFLHGYYNFDKFQQKQKKKLRENILKIYQSARNSLKNINQDHESLVTLQQDQDNILYQRLFSQKIQKINSIYQSIHESQDPTTLRTQSEEELLSLAQSLKNSKIASAKKYSSKNSFLNQNLCYSSVLRTSIQVISSSSSLDVKQKLNYDFQKLSNKIQSNVNSNIYLKQHTSNAFNDYLRASFWYFKGEYEASMVFLGKSDEILNNKLKSTEQRMLQEPDQQKRQVLRKKIHIIKQNNEVRIKICILKSKICINYKPNIHTLCITGLRDQEQFIKQKLFEYNSSLPELYYYEAYLMFQSKANKNDKIQKLKSAFTILIPQSQKSSSLKKQVLKYYTLFFSIVDGIQRLNTAQKIEQIAKKNKIVLSSANNLQMSLIEQLEIYYLFKIQEAAWKNKFSFLDYISQALLENQRKNRPLDKLIEMNNVDLLFEGENIKYWQIIKQIIMKKFENTILVSYKLFAYYFVYIQYLICIRKQKDIQALQKLILHLKIIVAKSQVNKNKFHLEDKNNNGFEDRIKTILLYCYRFAWKQFGDIKGNDIFSKDFIEHRDKYFKDLL